MELPNASEIAEKLCIKAEGLGLCHPTETMIAECLHDFEWNALMYPDAAWEHHGGKPDNSNTTVQRRRSRTLQPLVGRTL